MEENFNGIEVLFHRINGEIVPAYVAQCKRSQGITFHSVENDKRIACLNRQEIIEYLKRSDREEIYNAVFDELVKQIKSGKVTNISVYQDSWAVRTGEQAYGEPMECAFS